MRKISIIILSMLLVSIAIVSANGDHASEIAEGKQLVESKVSCDDLTNEQLEAIGEYYMEQMHPGEAHEAMHKMMGVEEGTEYHEQFHVNIAQMMYCGESGMMGGGMMMGSGGMNMMGTQGMMGNWGYGFGYWNFINVLYVILLIGLIILVYLWIIKLWKNMKSKGGKK